MKGPVDQHGDVRLLLRMRFLRVPLHLLQLTKPTTRQVKHS